MDESGTRSAASERIVRILEPGVREIGLQLLYSAAWLDDRYPDDEPDKPVRALHALQQQHPDAIGLRERHSTRPEVRSVVGEQTWPAGVG